MERNRGAIAGIDDAVQRTAPARGNDLSHGAEQPTADPRAPCLADDGQPGCKPPPGLVRLERDAGSPRPPDVSRPYVAGVLGDHENRRGGQQPRCGRLVICRRTATAGHDGS